MADSLTQEEATQQLWKDFVESRDPHLREQLILQYTPLVKLVIRTQGVGYSPFSDSSDQLSSGTIGLIEAVDRFDPERGVTFQTYAVKRIMGEIIDEMRRLDPLGPYGRAKLKKIQNAEGALVQLLGRDPIDRETAQFLGVSLDRYRKDKMHVSRTEVSWEKPRPDSSGELVSLENIIPDPNIEDTALVVGRNEIYEKLRAAVRRLPERERTIILLSYQEGWSFAQIVDRFNLSESRIVQLRARALRRMRRILSLEEVRAIA